MKWTREDWTEAGLAALAEGGLAGVAVEALARRLGATKGSFYWHFKDRGELVRGVLERWERVATDEVLEALSQLPTPRERLERLAEVALLAERTGRAESHLLASVGEPVVRRVLRRVTRKRLRGLQALFEAQGAAPSAARQKATLALATQLGMTALRAIGPERGAPEVSVTELLRGLLS